MQHKEFRVDKIKNSFKLIFNTYVLQLPKDYTNSTYDIDIKVLVAIKIEFVSYVLITKKVGEDDIQKLL